MYLEATLQDLMQHTKEELGLTPKVIYVGPGKSMIAWVYGATPKDSLRFAYQAVEIGAFFERQIGGDPKPWLERKQEIETLARENGIRLDGWN